MKEKKLLKKRKLTLNGRYFLKIRSRHPSHSILRRNPRLQFSKRVVLRLGSTTLAPNCQEINTIEGIKTSSNKSLMKQALIANNVKCAEQWNKEGSVLDWARELYPIVAKHNYGSRNNGNTFIQNEVEFQQWLQEKNITNYIFEKYYSFSREYRIHATPTKTFYTCRKVLRNDVPEKDRWFRNDKNSNWILEENPLFDKPVNWDNVCKEACKAIAAVGLDIGAVDVRIQSARTKDGTIRKEPDFIILETNSAPSFGELTAEKYINQLNEIINEYEF